MHCSRRGVERAHRGVEIVAVRGRARAGPVGERSAPPAGRGRRLARGARSSPVWRRRCRRRRTRRVRPRARRVTTSAPHVDRRGWHAPAAQPATDGVDGRAEPAPRCVVGTVVVVVVVVAAPDRPINHTTNTNTTTSPTIERGAPHDAVALALLHLLLLLELAVRLLSLALLGTHGAPKATAPSGDVAEGSVRPPGTLGSWQWCGCSRQQGRRRGAAATSCPAHDRRARCSRRPRIATVRRSPTCSARAGSGSTVSRRPTTPSWTRRRGGRAAAGVGWRADEDHRSSLDSCVSGAPSCRSSTMPCRTCAGSRRAAPTSPAMPSPTPATTATRRRCSSAVESPRRCARCCRTGCSPRPPVPHAPRPAEDSQR